MSGPFLEYSLDLNSSADIASSGYSFADPGFVDEDIC
jgi:hypothetical protein